MSKVHDLTGLTFNRLTVIRREGSNELGRATWLCRCECGNEIIVTGNNLLRNNTKSCGCLVHDVSSETGKHRKTHGHSDERLFSVWVNMRARCRSTKHHAYENYGGRGITVCIEWDSSYENFRDWALSNGYNPNAKRGECSLERKDNDGPYCPENCEWIPMSQQRYNRRVSILVTYNGVTKTASQWSIELGFDRHLVGNRIKNGWTVEKALTTPPKKRGVKREG